MKSTTKTIRLHLIALAMAAVAVPAAAQFGRAAPAPAPAPVAAPAPAPAPAPAAAPSPAAAPAPAPAPRAVAPAPAPRPAAVAPAPAPKPAPKPVAAAPKAAPALIAAAARLEPRTVAAADDAAWLAAVAEADAALARNLGPRTLAKIDNVAFLYDTVSRQVLGSVLGTISGQRPGSTATVTAQGPLATALAFTGTDDATLRAVAGYARARGERVRLVVETTALDRAHAIKAMGLEGGAVVAVDTLVGRSNSVGLVSVDPAQRKSGSWVRPAVAVAAPAPVAVAAAPAAAPSAPAQPGALPAELQACRDAHPDTGNILQRAGSLLQRQTCETRACSATPSIAGHEVCVRYAEMAANRDAQSR